MSIVKKFNPLKNLNQLDMLVDDFNESRHFILTDLPESLPQGRSSFLIETGPFLKSGIELQIDFVDSEGNSIYYEPIEDYLEGTSRRISVEVYSDTAPGVANIIIVGELDSVPTSPGSFSDVEEVPDDWKGIYNVRLTKEIIINPTEINTEPIRFYTQPKISVTEKRLGTLVRTESSSSIVTAFNSIQGNPDQNFAFTVFETEEPKQGSLSEVKDKKTKPKGKTDSIYKMGNQFKNKKGKRKSSIFKRIGHIARSRSPIEYPYSFEITNSDEFTTKDIGGRFIIKTIDSTQYDRDQFENSKLTFPPVLNNYTGSIAELRNNKIALLEKPFTNLNDRGEEVIIPLFGTVELIKQTEPTASYSTANIISYADVVLSDMRTFSGDVFKAKVMVRSEGSFDDFKTLAEIPVESSELMIDPLSIGLSEHTGYYENQDDINSYWDVTGGTAVFSNSPLLDGVYVSGSVATFENQIKYKLKDAYKFELTKNVDYTVSFNAYTKKGNDSRSLVAVYISGSSFQHNSTPYVDSVTDKTLEDDNTYGYRLGVIEVDDQSEKDLGLVVQNFTPNKTGDGVLQFRIVEGGWYFSDVSVKPSEDTGFSPSTFTFQKEMPLEFQHKRPDTFEFLVEFYDANDNIADSLAFNTGSVFTGGNVVITGNDNIQSGDMFLGGDSTGSGIHFGGVDSVLPETGEDGAEGSGFIRSIGYQGFISASAQSGSYGFMIYSGSVLPNSGDNYAGVGLELVGASGSLKFRTKPSIFEVVADAFFVGSRTTQFISGSSGAVEISSSNFHLTPQGNVTMSGIITAEGGNIGDFKIIGGQISGSNMTFNAPRSQLFKTDQGPGSDTTAGFEAKRNEYYIDFTPSESIDTVNGYRPGYYIKMGPNFMVDKDGILIASGAEFVGTITASAGLIGGFTTDSHSFSSNNIFISGSPLQGSVNDSKYMFISTSNFNVKQSGDVTGSKVLFTGGKLGGFNINNTSIRDVNNTVELSSALPGLKIKDNGGTDRVLVKSGSLSTVGGGTQYIGNKSFEEQLGSLSAGRNFVGSINSWSFSEGGAVNISLTDRNAFADDDKAVSGRVTLDVVVPAGSSNYASTNTYQISQIVTASIAAGDTLSFSSVARFSSSFGGRGKDRALQPQYFRLEYSGSGTNGFVPFLPHPNFTASNGYGEYFLGSGQYNSFGASADLPAAAEFIKVVLTGSINDDTGFTIEKPLFIGDKGTVNSDVSGRKFTKQVVGSTTAEHPETEITFDNFSLRSNSRRVEMTQEGLLIYNSEDSFIKMTGAGIEIRGGSGVANFGTAINREAATNDSQVAGTLGAPALQAYQSDPEDIGTTASDGNVGEFAKGNHVHRLTFSTVNSVLAGQTLTGTTFNGLFGSNARIAISGSLGANADVIRSLNRDTISGSLGSNAAVIRTLARAGISGSLGANADVIRTLTRTGISGSLGSNAALIRSLTRVGISGSLSANAIRDLGAGILSGSAGSMNSFNISDGATTELVADSNTITFSAGTGLDVGVSATDTVTYTVDVSDFMTNGANNRIITATGTDAMNAESNLTFDGSTLGVTGTISTTSNILLAAGANLFFDGGSNSYIKEHSADDIRVVAGGVTAFDFLTTGAGVPATAKLYLDGGGNTHLRESSADNIKVSAGGTDVLDITSVKVSGSSASTASFSKMSLNSVDPMYAYLNVQGDIALGSFTGTNLNRRIGLQRTDGAGWTNTPNINFHVDGNGDGHIKFSVIDSGVAGYADAMVIDKDGQVGIGITSPEGDLHISNTSPMIIFDDEDVSNLRHRIAGGGNTGLEYASDMNNVGTGYHRWEIGGSVAMKLVEGGSLRIGDNTNPSQTLDVVGGGSFTTSVFFNGRVRINHDGQVHWGAAYNQGYLSWDTNKVYVGGLSGNALHLQSNTSDAIVIDTSQNSTFSGNIISTKTNGLISGSSTSTGSFGTLESAGNSRIKGLLNVEGSNAFAVGSLGGVNRIDTAGGGTYTFRFLNSSDQMTGIHAKNVLVDNNIAVGGTVDGRDIASDGSKLDGIESGATADQTITAGTGLDGGGTGDVTLSVDVSDFMTNGSNNRVVTATGTDAMNAEGNLIFDGTNLGIGGSPDTQLHVKNSGGIELRLEADTNNSGQEDAFIRFYTDGKTQEGIVGMDNNNSSTLFSGNTENAMVFGTVSNLPTVFATNNTERMQISAAGNVGIGTNNPSQKLHIEGTDASMLLYDTNTAGLLTIKGAGNGYINAGISLQTTNGSHDRGMGIFMHDAGVDSEWFAGIPYATGGSYMIGYRTSISAHSNDTAQTTYALMVVKNNGNVGIGTTNPGTKLHINGGDWNTSLRIQGSGGASGINFMDSDGNTDGSVYAVSSMIGFLDPTGNWMIKAQHNNHISFAVNNATELMRINSSGNVGIGDTSPSRKLSVDGTIHVSSSDAAYTSDSWSRYIELDAKASGGGGIVWKGQSSGISRGILANQGDMYFGRSTADDNSAGATYDLFIKSTGLVGIGTSAPTEELTVFHATDPMINLRINTHDNAALILGDADGMKLYGQGASQQIRLYAETTEMFRVDSGGIVIRANDKHLFGLTTGNATIQLIGVRGDNYVEIGHSGYGIVTGTGNWALDGSDNMTVNANAYFGEYLYHSGDTDTFIRFTTDDINIQAGGVNFIDITQDTTNEITFNEEGADVNVRMEGDSDTHLFFLDAGNDKIGIGTSAPGVAKLNVFSSTAGGPFLYVGDGTPNNDSSWDANIMLDSNVHSRIRVEQRADNKNLEIYAHTGGNPKIRATDSATGITMGVGGTDSITVGTNPYLTVHGNTTITGDLTVNGTTTTVATTNMVVSDNLIELNNGASSNANDSGIVIERGSTGDNAIFVWDESEDRFLVGTTTATGASTGDLTITAAPLQTAALTSTTGTFGGAISATTLDTGQGANELYAMNQNVRTSDSVTFAGVSSTDNVQVQSNGFFFSTGKVTIQSGAGNTIALDAGTGADEVTLSTTTLASAVDVTIADTKTLGTSTFISGITGDGFRIEDNGSDGTLLEIDNIVVRNTLRTHIFQKDIVKATNGILFISDSGVISGSTGTTGTGTVTFDDDKSATFDDDEILLFKDAQDNGTINAVRFQINGSGTTDSGFTTYNVDNVAGNLSNLNPGGTAARISGGTVAIDASSNNSPYIDVNASSGSAVVRMGNIAGITSTRFGTLSGFGLWASGSVYLEGAINAKTGNIGTWGIGNTAISSSGGIITLDADAKRITITDGTNDRIYLGEVDGATTYGLKIFDGAGTNDENRLVELGEGANMIAGWDIMPGAIKSDNQNGSVALSANSQSLMIFTGSIDNARPKVVVGKLPRVGGSASDDRYGFGVFTGTVDADITADNSYNVLITRDKAKLAGWDLVPGNIQSDNTFGSVRLSSISQSLTIWTGSVNEAQPKLVLGKLPLHDGTDQTPYGFAVFSGSGTVSGSQDSASILITANKARLAGWELVPGQLKSGTVARIDGNQATIALGANAHQTHTDAQANLFYVSASATPTFFVGTNFKFINNTLTAAGWTVDTNAISKNDVKLDSTANGEGLYVKKTGFSSTTAGGFLGLDSGVAKFNVGNASKFIKFDGNNFTVDAGNFSLDSSGNVTANGTSHQFGGTITANVINATGSGVIGGFTIDANHINATNIRIDSADAVISLGTGTDSYDTANRIYLDGDNNQFSVGDRFKYDGTDLYVGDADLEHLEIDGTSILFKNASTVEAELRGGTLTLGGAHGATADAVVLDGSSVTIYGNDADTGIFITDNQIDIKSDGSTDRLQLDNSGIKVFSGHASNRSAEFGSEISLYGGSDFSVRTLHITNDGMNIGKSATGPQSANTPNPVIGNISLHGAGARIYGAAVDDYVDVKSDGVDVVAAGVTQAAFGATTTIGNTSNNEYVNIDSNGVKVYGGASDDYVHMDADSFSVVQGGVTVSDFGSSIIIGNSATDKSALRISSGAITLGTSNTQNVTIAANGDVSMTGTVTANAGVIGGFGLTATSITGSGIEMIAGTNSRFVLHQSGGTTPGMVIARNSVPAAANEAAFNMLGGSSFASITASNAFVEITTDFNLGTGADSSNSNLGALAGQTLGTIYDRPANADCFIAGTQILMANGSTKNIEDIVVGDLVKTYDVVSNQIISEEVAYAYDTIHTGEDDDYTIIIEFENGIINHNTFTNPYWVVGKGYASYDPIETYKKYELEVEQLLVGDVGLTSEGIETKIKSITKVTDEIHTYNFHVVKNENYFANNILVHNKRNFGKTSTAKFSAVTQGSTSALDTGDQIYGIIGEGLGDNSTNEMTIAGAYFTASRGHSSQEAYGMITPSRISVGGDQYNNASTPAIIFNGGIASTGALIHGTGRDDTGIYADEAYHVKIATNGTLRFQVDNNGVDVVGAITATGDVTAFHSSDKRLKENIELIKNPIEKVKQIRGVEFDWKEGNEDIHEYEGHDVGVIAQDVEKVMPEVVKDREDGYKGVRYEKMVGLLIEGMKEQQKQIEDLKSEIKELKNGSS